MNSISKLKMAIIILFFIIIIPNNKIMLPNIAIIIFSSFESFFSFFTEKITFQNVIYPLNSLLSFLGVVLFLSKKKFIIMLSLILQLNWVIYMFKISYLNYWYYTLTIVIYLILSIVLIYSLFFKKRTKNIS
jgi:hypothetical protein